MRPAWSSGYRGSCQERPHEAQMGVLHKYFRQVTRTTSTVSGFSSGSSPYLCLNEYILTYSSFLNMDHAVTISGVWPPLMLFLYRFALIQYQKAIRGLREFIDGLEKGRGGRSTLICCMVLTLFDCFYGNVGFAAQHIRFGRKLLSAWTSTDSNKPPNQITGDPIDYHLIHM